MSSGQADSGARASGVIFGCCGKWRECREAGACVIATDLTTSLCYRKKLLDAGEDPWAPARPAMPSHQSSVTSDQSSVTSGTAREETSNAEYSYSLFG